VSDIGVENLGILEKIYIFNIIFLEKSDNNKIGVQTVEPYTVIAQEIRFLGNP
jgi:hypothetical protein